jgi:hypothetical protein
MVPACAVCNSTKSRLETYALAVLPIGSRHDDAQVYAEQNIERRLAKNHALRRKLIPERNADWERHANGLLVPMMLVPIDTDKIYELFSLIVRGLYMYHWKVALDPARVQVFDQRVGNGILSAIIRDIGLGQTVRGDIGHRTFVYEAMRSATDTQFSLWQFSVFGGLELGRLDSPGLRVSRFCAVTRPN